jgi:hypothetical protein
MISRRHLSLYITVVYRVIDSCAERPTSSGYLQSTPRQSSDYGAASTLTVFFGEDPHASALCDERLQYDLICDDPVALISSNNPE